MNSIQKKIYVIIEATKGKVLDKEYFLDERKAQERFGQLREWRKKRASEHADIFVEDETAPNAFGYASKNDPPEKVRAVTLTEVDASEANESHLWAVYHCYDEDGGFGDAVSVRDLVGIAKASLLEKEEFLEKWDKPEVYAQPYADLHYHGVEIEEVIIADNIFDLVPYGNRW